MRLIEDIERMGRYPYPVVTVGSFDGVHLGHRKIIREVAARARKASGTAVLMTFEPHPQIVVAPESAPALLTTKEEKLKLLAEMDLDLVCIVPFSTELAAMSPEHFVRRILVETLGTREMVIGQNHAFGRERRGTARHLVDLGRTYGFTLHVVSPVRLKGRRISSSHIRDLITRGEVSEAAKALGRCYSFEGEVIEGAALGRLLNFPTANLRIDSPHKLFPGDGVYAIWAQWRQTRYAGMMNIGRRPTFGFLDRTIEVHLFDFQGDLYGDPLHIEVASRIRDEHRFQDEKELVAQIQKDKTDSIAILSQPCCFAEAQ